MEFDYFFAQSQVDSGDLKYIQKSGIVFSGLTVPLAGTNGTEDFSLFFTFDRTSTNGLLLASNDQWNFGVSDTNFLYIRKGNEGYNFPEINLSKKNTLALIRQDSVFNVYKLSQIGQQIESLDSVQFRPETNLGDGLISMGGADSGTSPFFGTVDQVALIGSPLEYDTVNTVFSGFLPVTLSQGTGTTLTYQKRDWFINGTSTDSGYLSQVFNNLSSVLSNSSISASVPYTGSFKTQATPSGLVTYSLPGGAGGFNVGYSGSSIFSGTQTGFISFIKDQNGSIYADYSINQYNQHAEFKRQPSQTKSFVYDTGYYTPFQMNGVSFVNPTSLTLKSSTEKDISKINKLGIFDYQNSLFKAESEPSGFVYYNGIAMDFTYYNDYIDISGVEEQDTDYLIYNLTSSGETTISNNSLSGNFQPKTSSVTKSGVRLHPTGYKEASIYHTYFNNYKNSFTANELYNDNWK